MVVSPTPCLGVAAGAAAFFLGTTLKALCGLLWAIADGLLIFGQSPTATGGAEPASLALGPTTAPRQSHRVRIRCGKLKPRPLFSAAGMIRTVTIKFEHFALPASR